MQAVLIEHDEIVLSDLSAVVVSEGRKGDNFIKDYDQVWHACIGQVLHVLAEYANKSFTSSALQILDKAVVNIASCVKPGFARYSHGRVFRGQCLQGQASTAHLSHAAWLYCRC